MEEACQVLVAVIGVVWLAVWREALKKEMTRWSSTSTKKK